MKKKYVLTREDQAKAVAVRLEGVHARRLRREAELALLEKLLAEAAMPERYPHQ